MNNNNNNNNNDNGYNENNISTSTSIKRVFLIDQDLIKLRDHIASVPVMHKELEIHIHSYYIYKMLTCWLEECKQRGWMTKQEKAIKNLEMWQKIDKLLSKRRECIHFIMVNEKDQEKDEKEKDEKSKKRKTRDDNNEINESNKGNDQVEKEKQLIQFAEKERIKHLERELRMTNKKMKKAEQVIKEKEKEVKELTKILIKNNEKVVEMVETQSKMMTMIMEEYAKEQEK